MNKMVLKTFNIFSLILVLMISPIVYANELAHQETQLKQKELYYCVLNIAKSNGKSRIVDIKGEYEMGQKIKIAYSDPEDPNDLQAVFTFPNANQDYISSLAGVAVLARLIRTEDVNNPILEIGFYSAKKSGFGDYVPRKLPDYRGGIQSSGVLDIPGYGWRYEPTYVVSSRYFSDNGSVDMALAWSNGNQKHGNLGAKLTANELYTDINLRCLKDGVFIQTKNLYQ